MSTSGFFCSVCEKTYSSHSNLRTHVKSNHPDQLNEIAPNKIKYNCEICSESFTNKALFNKHHKVHTSGLKCPLCEVIDVKPALIQHFTLVHNVDINIEQYDFQTIEEFNSWKEQIEEENTVYFPQDHGTFKTATYTRTKYQCHRSGTYQTRGIGKRHLKIEGSKKINAFCPASIILDYKNGIYNVKYTSTHIGHTNELRRIPLPKSDKLMLADKLANKIPFKTIIEDITGSLQDSKLERIHLLKKQDLRNIKRDFNLNNSAILNTNDAESVDLCVQKPKYTNTPFGHKSELCPEKDKLILADNTYNVIYNIEYPEKLQRKKKKQCKEILSCKNNGTKRDGCESQIAVAGGTNIIITENSETLEPMKKKQYKEILSGHKKVAFIKNNCDTQDDANVVHEIEELETLEASNEIQEFLSRYESIDVVEDNNDIQIAGDAFELVVDDSVHLDVDDDTIQLVEENLNYGINLEKRETLEKLKEKLKKTFLEALDKAITYEQCELIRKIIAPLHPTLDKCILMRGIEEEFDFTPVKCIAKKSKDPKLAKSISRKGTEVLDPMLAKYIPEKGIKKRLDHMSSILKKKTQKELVSMPSKCNPKKRTNEVLDPALAKSISDDGIQKELDHILARCISTEETQKYLGPTSAKCKPKKRKNKVLHPAMAKCISDDGTQKELGPTSAKCIPEQGTVEELDPTSGESKNRLNCEEMELKTNLDVLKNPLNCDQKQSAIKLNHKPLAYKCIIVKKKANV